jgi:amidase
MTRPIWQLSAVRTARAIRKREVSALEITRAHIERMHKVNPALNAVVVDMSNEAIKAAKAADRSLAKGAEIGPLHGVPITIKENIDVKGRPNPNGVAAQMDLIAPDDSPVVANFRKSGAIIIGLTNTPEFSMRGFTSNPLHGLTLNPWDANITCGGSSGGAGASIAAGIGTIAHGNDIGGSLRIPAFCNGVATIKPTQGRVPAYNPSVPVERPLLAHLMSTQGPIAREVGDLRLALEVMSARDPRDPWWVPAPLRGPRLKPPIHVALARIPDDMDADPAILAIIRTAGDHLSDAGYAVKEVDVPDITGVWQTWADIIATEMDVLQLAGMNAVGSADFKEYLQGFLKLATLQNQAGFMKTIAARSTHIRNWQMFFERFPIVLAPASVKPTPAPDADLGGEAKVREIFRNDWRFISAINVLGLPSAVVPVALHQGHPVGVQLIAGRYREDLCFDAAEAIEKKAGILVQQLWKRTA